ncbi:hypothetical protein MMC30_008538 [Trapelia coarctata]|nr:hypothetical protein [Trapelia coarctata]
MVQAHGKKTLWDDARRSLQQAVNFSLGCQQPDGHWVAPVSADATFTAQYVMFKYAISGLSLADDGAALQRWLLADQTPDGSWVLAPGLPGNLSTTVEAYLALRLLGTPASHPAMERARDFVLFNGGVVRVRFFTRFFLATFGLFPWAAIPQMPAELILLPTWAFLNIYVLSSWARSTLIPVLVVRHHEPVYTLPNGRNRDNDFLDELWCDPTDKNVPFAPPLWELFWGHDRDAIKLAFTLADKVLARLGGLKRWPLRQLALRRCIEWLLEHQEAEGDWAGFFPPIQGSLWALLLEGFPLHHKRVHLGMEALERLAVNEVRGKWLQSTVSPCWDTALMVNALCDAGLGRDARLARAAEWLRARQLMVAHGDWRFYAHTQQAGGWSFEYYNTFYPDVDDTAVVVMTLVKQDPGCINSKCILNAVEWILGMQNRDGGWGAFDINNDARWLHKIPFSDMDSLVDPSTSDVTGRMLECFGLLLAHRRGARLCRQFRHRVQVASKGGLAFLLKEQEAFGAWWGRWGNNYNYGTTNVLRGLVWFSRHDRDAQRAVIRAIRWLEVCQNDDGGWGEDLLSYVDPSLAGCGPSTAAQTAWALDSLLRFRPPSDQAIEKGVYWLVSNQTEKPDHSEGASWPYDKFVGTGFPNVLYLGYPFYHHLFPIQALSRYVDSLGHHEIGIAVRGLQLAPHIISTLCRPSILMMVLGSRGDIELFLSIAKRLHGCRVRIATHPAHQGLVQRHGFEFYDVGASPDEFARVLGQEPRVFLSIVKGEFATLRRSLCLAFRRFWQASIDSGDGAAAAHGRVTKTKILDVHTRPFLADVVVSGSATTVHVHAAEKLQAPLIIIAPQPMLPTSGFPHVFTMTKPSFSQGRWWNLASYFCLDLINWLVFGPLINRLRVKEYGMLPLSWTWATNDFLQAKIPHVCLWSSSVLPKPSEWDENVLIGGYSFLDDGTHYTAPKSLQGFLETGKPVVAVSFGSMTVPDPAQLISTLSSALGRIQATGVVCRSWSAELDTNIIIPPHIYLADAIPHGWLLPRVNGFIHHGGAGHTAAGLRAGVPMLLMPHFLDQYFWAAKVRELGLGPPPLELRTLTAQQLVASLQRLVSGQYQDRCTKIAVRIQAEGDGANVAEDVIMQQVPLPEMNTSCSVIPELTAHWRHTESELPLSGAAAACLATGQIISWEDLDFQPRVDWAERWREARRSHSWVHMLGWLANLIFQMLETLPTIVAWVIGNKGFPEEDSHAIKMRDPVRQARIRQAQFDLQLIKEHADEKEAAMLDDRVMNRWHMVASAEFHGHFRDRRKNSGIKLELPN